jgi:hypothetical protein
MTQRRLRRRYAAIAALTTATCWQANCIQSALAIIGASFF